MTIKHKNIEYLFGIQYCIFGILSKLVNDQLASASLDCFTVLFKDSLFQRIGLAPLKLELEKLGGWPLLQGDTWREDEFTW